MKPLRRRRHDFSDRVVLITGAGHGIGAATARALVAAGARVALLDRDEAAVSEIADGLGDRAFAHVADVTDPASLADAVSSIESRCGGIDVVIANAGIMGPVATFADSDPVAYDRMIEIDLLGVIRTVRAALPSVLARRGYVLVVSSAAAAIPCPTISGYGAAKAGVEAFGRALRLELSHTGASAGVAYFGMIDTGLVRDGLLNDTGLGAIVGSLPGDYSKPVPVEMAADAIVSGIARRARWVCAPGWVYGLLTARNALSVLDPLIGRSTKLRAAIEHPPQRSAA